MSRAIVFACLLALATAAPDATHVTVSASEPVFFSGTKVVEPVTSVENHHAYGHHGYYSTKELPYDLRTHYYVNNGTGIGWMGGALHIPNCGKASADDDCSFADGYERGYSKGTGIKAGYKDLYEIDWECDGDVDCGYEFEGHEDYGEDYFHRDDFGFNYSSYIEGNGKTRYFDDDYTTAYYGDEFHIKRHNITTHYNVKIEDDDYGELDWHRHDPDYETVYSVNLPPMRTTVVNPGLPSYNLTYTSYVPEYGMYHHNQSSHSHLSPEEEPELSVQAQALSLAASKESTEETTSADYLLPVASGLVGLVCGVAVAVVVMTRRAAADKTNNVPPAAADIL